MLGAVSVAWLPERSKVETELLPLAKEFDEMGWPDVGDLRAVWER